MRSRRWTSSKLTHTCEAKATHVRTQRPHIQFDFCSLGHPHSNIHFVIGQLLSVLWLLNGPTATPLLPSLRTAGCNQAFWRHHAEVSGPQESLKKFPPAEGTEWGRRFPIILPTLVLYFLTIVQSLYFSQSFERFSRRASGRSGLGGRGEGKVGGRGVGGVWGKGGGRGIVMGTWHRDGQKKKKLAQTVSFVCLFTPFWNKREKPELACFLLMSCWSCCFLPDPCCLMHCFCFRHAATRQDLIASARVRTTHRFLRSNAPVFTVKCPRRSCMEVTWIL